MITLIQKYRLEVAAGICGAAVMVFELLGSRVMSPYVGTSTYAWTSLIGVVLASLSLGYFLGGRLADRKPHIEFLAGIILGSAVTVSIMLLLKDSVSAIAATLPVMLEIKTLVLAVILFAPSSVLFGMVTPYAVRLRMESVAHAGQTAGNLYALSTIGSITGTFFAGFYLIPYWGTTFGLLALALVLVCATALLLGKAIFRAHFLLPTILVLILLSLNLFFAPTAYAFMVDTDTEYSRVLIFETQDPYTSKPIRGLMMDPYGTQAAIFTDGTDDLVFEYAKFYRLVDYFFPQPNHALLIGGSVYTYPHDFLKQFPAATMDVVEIDSGVTDLAREYFGLTDNSRLTIFHEDGRMFLNREEGKYDAIFIDAFNSGSSVPFQLTTREAIQHVHNMLNPKGIVMVNIISAITGEQGMFLRAQYTTYSEFFPHVYVFQVDSEKKSDETQNLILVALTGDFVPTFISSDFETQRRLQLLWRLPIEKDLPVLTDDFAPVEYYRRKAL
ncbi:MAG: hypothetical protein A2664_04160 [Candidatus Taylorbacteria bacterium RIFCSPHIGHO2_01_FULL_46_22b]|uniref:PABS domain-containing protein n=1 Tax=Candidatus Taylorbacteria bacterium RIFCSPHIGHO2_01_FULL_46_22b TaxID=1802301 RepID=A0A1G2M3Y2_9BACT|nr:MAG: hypothetical protein A2664_04160 [Candidatus Taylorbacteria bacterium RIFCSPHIGHO2_01_FULL_46_22b]